MPEEQTVREREGKDEPPLGKGGDELRQGGDEPMPRQVDHGEEQPPVAGVEKSLGDVAWRRALSPPRPGGKTDGDVGGGTATQTRESAPREHAARRKHHTGQSLRQ